jgi:hypothetical protein
MSFERDHAREYQTSTASSANEGTAPGRRSRAAQMTAPDEPIESGLLQRRAAHGVTGPSQPFPHRDAIQASFGRHDVSGVQAHIGGRAAEATEAMGAEAYATGNDVAFGSAPDLFTAAHEAAHVIQQRHGVQLLGGIGQVGDRYEQHADAVASLVVQGRSAQSMLDQFANGAGATSGIQNNVQCREPKAHRKPNHIEMPPDFVGKKAPAKGADNSNQAPEAVDFSDLDAAFANVATHLRTISDVRGIAVREVLGNLNEADSPTIADQILKTFAIAALGAASGGITNAIAGKLAQSSALNGAIQTALDDGLKDAVLAAVDRLAATGSDTSKATFFASQEQALALGHGRAEVAITKATTSDHKAVLAAPTDGRQAVLGEKLAKARKLAAAAEKSIDAARQIQYQHSLSAWMTAMAQGALGSNYAGTKLDDELDVGPKSFMEKRGEKGVIYVAMGGNSSRPVKVKYIKVSGMTDAARQRVKNVPIRDLPIPVVATGFFTDGSFADDASKWVGDNEMSLGRTERGHVSYYGHEDAREAMKEAAGTSTVLEAAEVIMEQDIGRATLADAKVRG